MKNRKLLYKFIYIILSLFIIISIIYIFNFFLLRKEAIEESNLLNFIAVDTQNYNNISENSNLTNTENLNTTSSDNLNTTNENIVSDQLLENNTKIFTEQNVKTERMSQVESLKKENPDIVGWLEIPDTTINYPVLQGTDNEYYMTHNYKREKSKNGSIFLSKDYDFSIPSSNLLIYGHNLGNGTMFQPLLNYENKNYYLKHPKIRFTTVNDDSEYEIISAFKSRVYYKKEKNVFRYYYFINANNESEYNEFVQNTKNASLYETGKTAIYGDQLLTLSTCSYYVKDGRFAVVARKIE